MEEKSIIDNPFLFASLIVEGNRRDFITDRSLDELVEILSGERSCSKYHIVNKNGKLKRSKMFLNKKVLTTICNRHGQTLSEHLRNVENGLLSENDVRIILDVYQKITKIIK